MRLERSELSKAVQTALSLGAVAAVGVAGSAFAQTNPQTPQTLQTIVVTGSHIRRVDLETSNPVVSVTREQIQQSGKLTLGDILQGLPAVMGPQTNPQVNNAGGSGSSTVALRGLGANRSLVLIDGHRVNPSVGAGFTDVNAIPANMIERIEVLTTGASAVYGSEAIGGVVNVITRQNYQGAEFSADYGISDRNDGARNGFSFTFGQASDKGNLVAGLNYNKQDAIFQGDRKNFGPQSPVISLTSSSNVTYPVGLAGGSATGVLGNITIPSALTAQYGCGTNTKIARNAGSSGAATTDYHCFGQADKYNYADVNYTVTPQERTSAFLNGTYHLSDNIDAYAAAYHTKTAAAFDLAPSPITTGGGLVVDAANPYNPFGVEYSTTAGRAMGFRAVPLGLRGAQNGKDNDQAYIGLRGSFELGSQTWNWDIGYDYGHSSFKTVTLGLPNLAVLNPHFGAYVSTVGGVQMCGDPTSPVTCANPFNVDDPNTVAALQGSIFNPVSIGYGQLTSKHATISGGLFEMAAGTAQLAVGIDKNDTSVHTFISPDRQVVAPNYSCSAGSQCSGSIQGGFGVKEAYAELFLPILKDLPFVRALNVTLGDRYSKYSNVGSTNNPKIGVEWRPIDDLLLRGTVASVFRAPNTSELFGAPASSATKLSHDPCDHYTGAPAGSGAALACAGVPTDGSYVNSDVSQQLQTSVVASGAGFAGLPLGPESGKTFDMGAVYSPHFVPGLSVSVDVWRVYLNNIITALAVQNELDLCYAGGAFAVQYYCPLIHRLSASHDIAPNTVGAVSNLGRVDTRGVDLSLRYRLPEMAIGQFNVGLDTTYLAQYDNQSSPGAAGNLVTRDAGHFLPFGSPGQGACPAPNGGVCLFPRIRGSVFANWQMGSWDASWRTRYISRFTMGSKDLSQGVTPAGSSFPGFTVDYGATVYNDVTIGYNIQPINTKVELGVDNLLDKAPPLLYGNNTLNANTDPSDFDLIGRYYRARITVKF